ncbi:hypothetical protein GQX74_010223 [Glossina fuscipes]|nr:hypothetical protein GQX74_010223 [Glossina fuscipes]
MLCSYTRSPNVTRERTGLRMRGRAIGFEVDFVGLVISAFVSIYGLELMLTVPLIVVITADGLAVILNDAVSSSFKFFKPFKFNVFSLETSCIVLSGAFLKAQGLCRSSDCDCCSCLLSIFANFDEWRTAKLFKLNDDLMDSSKFGFSFMFRRIYVVASSCFAGNACALFIASDFSSSCSVSDDDVANNDVVLVSVISTADVVDVVVAVTVVCSIITITAIAIENKVLYFAIKASMEESNSQIIKECDR